MKVFVTGGNGFIGSVVVRTLAQEGHEVVCLLRPTSDISRIQGVPFTRVDGDVRDLESIRLGMEGASGVIHLASLSSWDLIDSPEMRAVVEDGTRNVLQAARDHGGLRVVFVSSLTAVGATPEPRPLDESCEYNLASEDGLAYSQYKHRAEAICRDFFQAGLPVVIVNPAEVYGPNDTSFITAGNLLDFARSNPVLVCNGGTSVAHVEDVALGIVRALEKGRPGERYILGGENLTLRQLAEVSLDLMGKRSRVVTVPNGVLRAVTRMATSLKLPLPYNPKVIPYATRFWFADASKARRELAYQPRSLQEGLTETLEHEMCLPGMKK